jgi:hypothetical protein
MMDYLGSCNDGYKNTTEACGEVDSAMFEQAHTTHTSKEDS